MLNLISIVIYKINQLNINKIIELYTEAGLYMSERAKMSYFLIKIFLEKHLASYAMD